MEIPLCEECDAELDPDDCYQTGGGGAVCPDCKDRFDYVSCIRCEYYYSYRRNECRPAREEGFICTECAGSR